MILDYQTVALMQQMTNILNRFLEVRRIYNEPCELKAIEFNGGKLDVTFVDGNKCSFYQEGEILQINYTGLEFDYYTLNQKNYILGYVDELDVKPRTLHILNCKNFTYEPEYDENVYDEGYYEDGYYEDSYETEIEG